MRLGLFGGTFDPIHLGHLILAESCREACGLDRVRFVVAGAPPHKPGDRTAVADRLEMARIAVAGHPAFEVSDIEARRPGPHYSVETLEAVHAERPEDDLFFLIGADSLADLPLWRSPDRIVRLASLVVVNRPGIDPDDPGQWPDLGPDALPIAEGLHPADRDRLARPPPTPGRGPEHPLPGPPRRRGLHRCARPLPPGGGGLTAGARLRPSDRGRARPSWRQLRNLENRWR